MTIPFDNKERRGGDSRQNEIMGRIMQLENELDVLRRSGLSIVSPSIVGMRDGRDNHGEFSVTNKQQNIRAISPAFSLGERSHSAMQGSHH